jgi:hypothetical protein
VIIHVLSIFVKIPVLSSLKKILPLICKRISENVVEETQTKIGLRHRIQSSILKRREEKKIE